MSVGGEMNFFAGRAQGISETGITAHANYCRWRLGVFSSGNGERFVVENFWEVNAAPRRVVL
jgi:hypothetical protein